MANTIIMTLKCEPRSPSTHANTETPAHINSLPHAALAVRYQFNRSDIAEYIRPQRLAGRGIVKRAKFNGR